MVFPYFYLTVPTRETGLRPWTLMNFCFSSLILRHTVEFDLFDLLMIYINNV